MKTLLTAISIYKRLEQWFERNFGWIFKNGNKKK